MRGYSIFALGLVIGTIAGIVSTLVALGVGKFIKAGAGDDEQGNEGDAVMQSRRGRSVSPSKPPLLPSKKHFNLTEGYEKKGGVNPPPTTPKPMFAPPAQNPPHLPPMQPSQSPSYNVKYWCVACGHVDFRREAKDGVCCPKCERGLLWRVMRNG